MSIDKHIEKFGKEFIALPVKNVRYWAELGMHIGEVLVGNSSHTTNSTIAFEFYDKLDENSVMAYKPTDHYKKEL